MMNQSQAEFRRKGENPFSLEPVNAVRQISSFLLLGQAKCLHIEHEGLIY